MSKEQTKGILNDEQGIMNAEVGDFGIFFEPEEQTKGMMNIEQMNKEQTKGILNDEQGILNAEVGDFGVFFVLLEEKSLRNSPLSPALR
ncbi:MAG: hypothetical protein HYU71_02380 [Bacteroidetes bacterium]|nr:hypothetical protein [Bacteroidota bacterium]